MKVLRKPLWIGTSAQVEDMRVQATTEGGHAARTLAARAALGRKFAGQPVRIVKVPGLTKRAVIAEVDAGSLPDDVQVLTRGVITASDDLGGIVVG